MDAYVVLVTARGTASVEGVFTDRDQADAVRGMFVGAGYPQENVSVQTHFLVGSAHRERDEEAAR